MALTRPTGGKPSAAHFFNAPLTNSDMPLSTHVAVAPVTVPAYPITMAQVLPTFDFNQTNFHAMLTQRCPLGTDVPALIGRYAGKSFLRRFKRGERYLVAHRGFQGAFPGQGVLAEQSEGGLKAPYACGVTTVEADPSYTAGGAGVREEIFAHDSLINRLFEQITGGFDQQNWDEFQRLRIVFKPVAVDGRETGEVYATEQRPITMDEFVEKIFLCYDDNDILYDTRERTPGDKIAEYIRMIDAEKDAAKRTKFIENAAFQVYPHGYPGGGPELLTDIKKKLGRSEARLIPLISKIKLSLVMPSNGAHKILSTTPKLNANDPVVRL